MKIYIFELFSFFFFSVLLLLSFYRKYQNSFDFFVGTTGNRFWFCWMLKLTSIGKRTAHFLSGSQSAISHMRKLFQTKVYFFVASAIKGRKFKNKKEKNPDLRFSTHNSQKLAAWLFAPRFQSTSLHLRRTVNWKQIEILFFWISPMEPQSADKNQIPTINSIIFLNSTCFTHPAMVALNSLLF